MKHFKLKLSLLVIVVFVVGIISYVGIPSFSNIRYGTVSNVGSAVIDSSVAEEEQVPRVAHLSTPEPFKAIYMSQCVAGTPSFRDKLVTLIDETELNSVIIDIKDFSGKIGFSTSNPVLRDSVSDECGARDLENFLQSLHDKGIYVVGRITVFQDPFYANERPDLAVLKASDGTIWKDFKGLSFIDVGAKPFWDYIVALSKESYDMGFDELNYDYIRYPSDGPMKDIAYPHSGNSPRQDVLEEFFAYLHKKLNDSDVFKTGDGPKLSADLFGYTTTNTDDLGIGQIIERALPYFDYVMPMVYPSHYNSGFIGYENPAIYPYDVVNYSMDKAVERTLALRDSVNSTSTEQADLRRLAMSGHGNISKKQLRTWIQDFDLGATYTPEMVRKQIQATYDAGLTSWALWDAGNTYTKSALFDN